MQFNIWSVDDDRIVAITLSEDTVTHKRVWILEDWQGDISAASLTVLTHENFEEAATSFIEEWIKDQPFTEIEPYHFHTIREEE